MKRKIKNTFLKGFTVLMGVMWWLAVLGADSNPVLAVKMLLGATAWLTYFGWCNGWVNFKFEGENNVDFQK